MALTRTPPAPYDALRRELDWLAVVLAARLRQYFELDDAGQAIEKIPVPKLPPVATDAYARLVKQEKLGWPERLVLALALAPHLRPQVLDPLFARNRLYDRSFTEFGGLKGKGHAGFLPTGETALFLLAGADLARRLSYQTRLWTDSPLATAQLVQLGPAAPYEPLTSGPLTVPPDALALLTTNVPVLQK